MEIKILYRPSQSLAQVWLAANESIVAESGAMVGMTPNVLVQTQSRGIVSGIKRLFGGESFFRNTFTAQHGQGEVLFATPLCGDMAVLEVGERQWCMQNGAYVACSQTVDLSIKSGAKSFFAGVGFFILESKGRGQLLIGSFGAIEPVHVEDSMVINTGHVVAWESTLQYEITRSASGLVASFLSGEGLLCRFKGQGIVYVQSRNASEYGRAIGAMLPAR